LENVGVKAEIEAFKAKGAEKALVTIEDLVKLLYDEAQGLGEDTTSSARTAAIKVLTDFTGGFDANVKKVAVDTDVVFNMAFGGDKDET
jgi:hypothetical protein